MDHEQHEDLHRRLERLERGYHKWRRTAIAATGVTIALLVYSAYTYAQQPGGGKPPAPEPAQDGARRPSLDATGMQTSYANYARVSGTFDEVIIDFGFDSQIVTAAGDEPIKFSHRVVMNFYTAKNLRSLLQTIMTRHEDAFGEIEPDPTKRMQPRGGRK